MDGRGSSSTAPHRQVTSRASTALAAVSIVLILLYLLWRFVWQAKKQGTSSGTTAASPSSSSSAPQPSWPSRVAAPCLGAGEAAARRVLPVFVVHVVEATKDGSGAEKADCAVCLGELGVGDQAAARLVPGCGHGFHAECIEAWFRVNSTCPLCRATVAAAGHATGRA